MVLTKVDMVPVKDGRNKLSGKACEVKLGIFGVVNQIPDSEDIVDMGELLDYERKYFQENYPDIAHQHGICALEKALCQVPQKPLFAPIFYNSDFFFSCWISTSAVIWSVFVETFLRVSKESKMFELYVFDFHMFIFKFQRLTELGIPMSADVMHGKLTKLIEKYKNNYINLIHSTEKLVTDKLYDIHFYNLRKKNKNKNESINFIYNKCERE